VDDGEIARLGYKYGYIVSVRDDWGLCVLRPSLMPGRLSSSVRRRGAGKVHIGSYLKDNLAALQFGWVRAPPKSR